MYVTMALARRVTTKVSSLCTAIVVYWSAQWYRGSCRCCSCMCFERCKRRCCRTRSHSRTPSIQLHDRDIIGKGHFGTVFNTHDGNVVKRIERVKYKASEVSCMKHMKPHACIVRFMREWSDKSYCYVIVEHLDGTELFDVLDNISSHKRERFTNDELLSIARSMLRAIEHVHDANIVHRDVKPENFMYSDPTSGGTGRLVLIDFGLARSLPTDTTFMRSKVGTPYYMAPEIVRRYGYNQLCDEWSLGVILYTCIHLYPPFNGDTDQDILQCIHDSTHVKYDRTSLQRYPTIACLLPRLLNYKYTNVGDVDEKEMRPLHTRRVHSKELLRWLPPPPPPPPSNPPRPLEEPASLKHTMLSMPVVSSSVEESGDAL